MSGAAQHTRGTSTSTATATATPGKWKAYFAVQNNGPDYWVVSTGKWQAPVIATCAREADAELIALAPTLLAERDQLAELNTRLAVTNATLRNELSALTTQVSELRAAAQSLLPLLDDPGTYTWQEREPLVAKLRTALA